MDIAPLVTVYIPTWNRLNLLKRALHSVLEQTHTHLEVIVVDDQSTDGTQAYLQQLAATDRRVKPIFKTANSGACVSRNLAIEQASGAYITGLDDDDYFMPDRIETFVKQRALLDKYCFLYTHYLTLTGDNQYRSTRFVNRLMPAEICAQGLLFKNIIGSQCFTLTERLRQVGKFTPDMPAWQDLDLFYRLLKQTGFHKAKLLPHSLYIQDVSHDQNRISLSNKNRIRHAFTLFCARNDVSGKEQRILEAQLVSYGIKVSNRHFLSRFTTWRAPYFWLVDIYLVIKNRANSRTHHLAEG
ncbi:glycosyltransferase [Candidatus Pantoea soli]|nr:glycosyltransferase [Pantoea soli]